MKVAIVGGGICGLYLSWKLSERGFKVSVFEKKKEIGKKSCSGLFSKRILDFIPQSKNLIENRIGHVFLHFPKKTVKVKFSKEFLVMSHYELDRLVAGLSEKAKTKIFLGKKIDFLPDEFDRIIGCDGANSQIRKSLLLKNPSLRLGIQGFLHKKDFSDFVETWPTKSGFLWKIPRGKETEYGIVEKVSCAKKIFDEFVKKKNIPLERINSAIIPEDFILSSNSKVTLCGDSMGLTKPWSGGGVIWSLTACDILLKNFPDFLEYKKELEKFFLPRIIFSKIATKLIYFLGFKTPFLLPKNAKMENDFLI
jgi:flavin-dependent dehydrogenase